MARPKRGERLSLTIDDLAFGGEAVGRADGYVVFVPGGVPGDRVHVRLEQARSRFGRGVIEAIDEPSPHRVAAPCPYFGRCGGCRLQHITYSAQLAFKAKQVADVLERVGGLTDAEIRPIMGAEETYGYRNKMEFTVTSRRGGEGVAVGLHEADRYDSVLDIERCLLQSEGMNALLDEARRFFVERGFSAYEQASGEGLLRFLMLRDGRRTGEAMVNVVTAAPAVSELAPLVERMQTRWPGTSSVVMNVNPKKASVAVGVEEHLLGGRDHIREGIGGLTFQISANSFFQTNTVQAERLFDVVLAAAALEGAETAIDLYSGTGAISLLLARRCRWVYGVELAQAAVDDAGVNAAANGIANCTFLAGEVRFVLPSLIAKGGDRRGRRGRSAARRLSSEGALRARDARARAHRLRVLQPVHARPRPRRARPRRLSGGVGPADRHVPAYAPHRGRRPPRAHSGVSGATRRSG